MENELQKLKTAADELEQQLDKSQRSLGEFGSENGESRENRLGPGMADFDERESDEGKDEADDAEQTTAQATTTVPATTVRRRTS